MELTRLLPIDELRSGAGWDNACYRRLVRRPGLRLRPVWEGARWNVGRWRVTVLHPPPGARSGRNERSLVLRARLDGVSLLLTGDTGGSVERRLVARYGAALSSAVLKVGHHGSARSTSKAFLDAVRPRLALVSSGAGNVYGHPTEETLRRLETAGARVLRTDTGGQVVLTFPGGGRWRIRQPWIGVKAAAVP